MLFRELYAYKTVCQKCRYVVFEQLSQLNTGKFTNMHGKLLLNYIHSYIHRNCPYLEADPLQRGSASRIHQHTVPKRDHLQNSSTYSPPKWVPPLEFINIQLRKRGLPLEFIKIQIPKRDPPLEFINQMGSTSIFQQPKGGLPLWIQQYKTFGY